MDPPPSPYDPYHPPQPDAAFSSESDKPPQPQQPVKVPHPHLGWALLWALALIIVQIVLGIGIAIIYLVFLSVKGGRPSFTPPEELILILISVGTLSTFLFSVAVVFGFFEGECGTRLPGAACPVISGFWYC